MAKSVAKLKEISVAKIKEILVAKYHLLLHIILVCL